MVRTASILAAAFISRSPREKEPSPAARASMAAETGVRLGAAELALDCLRRYLQGLPVT
jgi:hypothetical protein